ncbi:MAG: DUF721 domain-containing protein [Alphaproteobacteria bacterium]|nr:DUF721 domain-containing protein [Alphaproteobacteria bacterium]
MKDPRRPRSGGPRPVSRVAARLVSQAFGQRGFVHVEILTRWPTIVGTDLGSRSQPERLRPGAGDRAGVLEVRAPGGLALEFQHRAPEIIERINAYFGYRAVARIAIVQGPVAPAPGRKRRAPASAPDPADEAALATKLGGVADPRLKEALRALGRHVENRKPRPKAPR